jgi:hypothetical protein
VATQRRAIAEKQRDPRLYLKRKLVDAIVSQRLFRQDELEALFAQARANAGAEGTEERETVEAILTELQAEMEFE